MLRKRKKKNPLVPGAPITFRALDEARGEFLEGELPRYWALEIWFADLYDVPFDTFTEFDLERSCRQHCALEPYMEAIVAQSLQNIEQAAPSWWQYDGELLYALAGLPGGYWVAHPEQRDSVIIYARRFLHQYEEEDIYNQQVARFLSAVGNSE